MSLIDFSRHPDGAPGTWWWVKGEWGPTIGCLSCRTLLMISPPHHEVKKDGVVEPAVVCPSCQWQGSIRLLGWKSLPTNQS